MAPIVFTKFKMALSTRIIGTLCFLVFGLIIGFLIGIKMYHNPSFEENIKVLKMLVKSRKRSIKGKEQKNVSEVLAKSFQNKILAEDQELLKNQIQEGTLSVV